MSMPRHHLIDHRCWADGVVWAADDVVQVLIPVQWMDCGVCTFLHADDLNCAVALRQQSPNHLPRIHASGIFTFCLVDKRIV